MGRVNGSDAGAMARPLWVCSNCRCWHKRRDDKGRLIKPMQCDFCQRMEFDYFHSEGEAMMWATLHLRQKAGEIRNLRRQVKIDLMTVGREGLACKWAEIVLDYAFDEPLGGEWKTVHGDYKPAEGMSPDAALKLRCLEAMGIPVRIFTKNGEV